MGNAKGLAKQWHLYWEHVDVASVFVKSIDMRSLITLGRLLTRLPETSMVTVYDEHARYALSYDKCASKRKPILGAKHGRHCRSK